MHAMNKNLILLIIHAQRDGTPKSVNRSCSEIHTQNTSLPLSQQNVEFMNVKPGGTCSNH